MLKRLMMTGAAVLASTTIALADRSHSCDGLPHWSELKAAVTAAVGQSNGGLAFNMWATLVANDGTVCAVAFSGKNFTNQWLASRVISAQKANTANGLSLGKDSNMPGASLFPTGLALSTANLYAAVQPGGSLYGLQFSNPVDPSDAYLQRNGQPDNPADFGTDHDPMVGRPIGGVNVFGGGLGLYRDGVKIGGVGVSGDTSCTDHFVAWRVRNTLGLDQLGTLVGGVAGVFVHDTTHPDNIIFDIPATPDVPGNIAGNVGVSKSGFGHPQCLNGLTDPTVLPPVTGPGAH